MIDTAEFYLPFGVLSILWFWCYLNSIANENKENFHHFDSQWRNKGDTRIIGYVPVQKRPDIACIFSVMSLFSVSAYSLLQGNLHDKAKQDQAPLNYAHLLSTTRFLKMGRKFEERLFSLYQRFILNNQAKRFTFVIKNVFFWRQCHNTFFH